MAACASPPAAGAAAAPGALHGVVPTAVSSARGLYRITLPPGLYAVTAGGAAGVGGRVRPAAVRVRAREARRVDFLVDTGIR